MVAGKVSPLRRLLHPGFHRKKLCCLDARRRLKRSPRLRCLEGRVPRLSVLRGGSRLVGWALWMGSGVFGALGHGPAFHEYRCCSQTHVVPSSRRCPQRTGAVGDTFPALLCVAACTRKISRSPRARAVDQRQGASEGSRMLLGENIANGGATLTGFVVPGTPAVTTRQCDMAGRWRCGATTPAGYAVRPNGVALPADATNAVTTRRLPPPAPRHPHVT